MSNRTANTLPILKQPIKVADMYPSQVESAMAQALLTGNVLVNRLTIVSVAEYRSRPILLTALMADLDANLNIALNGGGNSDVPGGNVYVRSVKKPGVLAVREAHRSGVLRALAVSEGTVREYRAWRVRFVYH